MRWPETSLPAAPDRPAGTGAAGLPGRGFSYAAVVASVLVGWLLPGAAPLVLGPPVLAGLLLLGLAHGACDQFVVPAVRPLPVHLRTPARYWAGFLLAYLGLALLMLCCWWRWPGATVALFFGLTVWHWGTADAPRAAVPSGLWLLHGVARGLLLFAVPAAAWPGATLHIVQDLLAFAGAALLPADLFTGALPWLVGVAAAGHLALWLAYTLRGQAAIWHRDALEVALLTALFVALPPVLALGVYFNFWHSWQHIVRLNATWAPTPRARAVGQELVLFVRKAWPLLLVSLLALGALVLALRPHLQTPDNWLSLALVVASVVTLPHAVLVSAALDAHRWRWSG